jgi:hypothetical protein
MRTAFSQTPAPLQEWQYSRGWVLLKLFELKESETLLLAAVLLAVICFIP